MLSLAVCVLFLGLAHAQSVIDPNNCFIRTAGSGETVICPDGYLVTGLCASEIDPGCNGQFTNIKCCPLLDISCTGGNYENLDGYDGNILECSGGAVISACTSGEWNNCGRIKHTRIICLDNPDVSISEECYWQGEDYGNMIECGTDEVATGACTSGKIPTCDGHSHLLECCRASHSQKR